MLGQTIPETKYTGLSMVGKFFIANCYKELNMVSCSTLNKVTQIAREQYN